MRHHWGIVAVALAMLAQPGAAAPTRAPAKKAAPAKPVAKPAPSKPAAKPAAPANVIPAPLPDTPEIQALRRAFRFGFAPYEMLRTRQAQVARMSAAGMGTGTRLVEFSAAENGLEAKELWTSLDMKPDYNDILIHEGNIYGFDNAIFACIGLEDGKRKWKGGRYAKGQALLLADSGLIVVVSEKGELVLLRATAEKHEELGKIEALSDKTWNHPVVVGDRLYLRNADEVVCYELAPAG
jgi:hypothetical protein